MSIENPSATEYIQHHMQHLQSLHQQVIVDFSVFNYDTLFFSILSLLVVFFVLRVGAKKYCPSGADSVLLGNDHELH